MPAFHQNHNYIHIELIFLTFKAHNHKMYVLSSTKIFGSLKANSVDPDQTAPVGAVCSGSVHNVCFHAYDK